MIVVVGRPSATIVRDQVIPSGMAASVALEAAAAGGSVELVGTVGDDDTGDALTVALGRRGVGHAALLRIAGAATPAGEHDALPPRLDAGDVELGLRYLTTIGVIVTAEALPPDVAAIVAEAAAYHGAPVVEIAAPGAGRAAIPDATTLEPGAGDAEAFARLVGRYAAALDAGIPALAAFDRARDQIGWTRHA